MFCKNCGNQLADDARFCAKCGSPTTAEAPETDNVSPDTPDIAPAKTKAPLKMPTWLIPVIIVCALVLVFLCFYLIDGFSNNGKTFGEIFGFNPFPQTVEEEDEEEKDDIRSDLISLPDFIGMTEAEIIEEYSDSYKFTIERDYKPGVDPGEVYDQNPAAGKDVKKGSEITIMVSLGDKSYKFPNVYGKPLTQAEAAIRDAGFDVDNIEIVEETHPSIEKGHVIESAPKALADASADVNITLIISKGPDPHQ